MSFRNCYTCGRLGHLARQCTASPPPASLPMDEEDRSDVGSDDNIASQTVVQNLELLTTTLHYFRSEIAIVCEDIGKQSAAVKILLSAAKETAREMKDLKVLMTTMSERIDKLTEENRALREQTPVPATQPLPPPPSTPPPRPKRKWTGPQTPHQPAKQLRDTSPHRLSCTRSMRMWKPTPRNPRHQHLIRPQGPHLAMATRTRDGRRLKGSAKGKERREGQDLEERWAFPSWADKARGRGGVSVTFFIGGNRDARPQKARKPKKGSELSSDTERQRRGGRGSGRVSP